MHVVHAKAHTNASDADIAEVARLGLELQILIEGQEGRVEVFRSKLAALAFLHVEVIENHVIPMWPADRLIRQGAPPMFAILGKKGTILGGGFDASYGYNCVAVNLKLDESQEWQPDEDQPRRGEPPRYVRIPLTSCRVARG